MRRRWKRRLLWAAVLFGVLLLAIPASSRAGDGGGRGQSTQESHARTGSGCGLTPLSALR